MDYAIYEAEVFARLEPLGEPERAVYAQNDKKSQLQFLAIKFPILRQLEHESFSFYQRPAT